MQPFLELTLSRPWHWGIAIVSARGAPFPETLDESLVTATADALVIKVRHAQDIEADVFEGDWDWATATLRVRHVPQLEDDAESVIHEGTLSLPDGCLTIGDADGQVTIGGLDERSRVQVHAARSSAHGAEEVDIYLAPSPA